MPTLLKNQKATSSKFKSQSNSQTEPRVLTKFDTKPYRLEKDHSSILDSSFKSDYSDSLSDEECKLTNPDANNNVDKFEPIKYDGFQVKVLPSKEKILLRNNFMYMDPKTLSIVWPNVIAFIILHLLAFYGLYRCFAERKFYGFISSYLFGIWGGLGITAGAHRLWSHRSYKARLPLRIFLMIGHTIAGQNNLFIWCRDHRVHHKFSETDADPHNSLRGFFFAHMGWLLKRKHPDVFIVGAKVPLDDIRNDPVVRFQTRFYFPMYFLFAFFIPTSLGAYFFNEGWWFSFLVCSAARYVTSLHGTWFVNSAAHMFGGQPYNVNQRARENLFVSGGALGEGFHNYHHAFPFDYATSELNSKLNPTKYFIDLMALFGLAYDLKRCSRKMIDSAMTKSLIVNEGKKMCAY